MAKKATENQTTIDELNDAVETTETATATDAVSATSLAGLFAATATAAVSGSDVIGTYKKFKGRDIAAMYPDGVYICDFDIITVRDRNTKESKPVAVYNFSATVSGDVEGFTMGGSIINRLVNEWVLKIGGGDVEKARTLYKQSGSKVRVTLTYELTDSGNTIQRVKVG